MTYRAHATGHLAHRRSIRFARKWREWRRILPDTTLDEFVNTIYRDGSPVRPDPYEIRVGAYFQFVSATPGPMRSDDYIIKA